MSLTHEQGFDDGYLVRYLLGLLPEQESERLDELSIADDEMAWRLRSAEDDLVDGYVRGALDAETRRRFETVYLSSPRRRERVEFAASLIQSVDRTPAAAETAAVVAMPPRPERAAPPPAREWQRWALAAMVLLASAVLLFQQIRMRSALDAARTQNAALDRRVSDLEGQLAGQRNAAAEAASALERARASLAERSPAPRPDDGARTAPPLLSLVLFPQTRGVGPVETLTVPASAESIRLDLRLELNDFPRYQAALRDPATNQIVWRTGPVAAQANADAPTVSVAIPAGLLKSQHYAVELSGRDAAGRAENHRELRLSDSALRGRATRDGKDRMTRLRFCLSAGVLCAALLTIASREVHTRALSPEQAATPNAGETVALGDAPVERRNHPPRNPSLLDRPDGGTVRQHRGAAARHRPGRAGARAG